MLLNVFIIHCISVATANFNLFQTFLNGFTEINENQTAYRRFPRQTNRKDDFEIYTPTCEQMSRTTRTPFVVIILYKSSGRFLGMGSIIDRKTVLTASRVVEISMHTPSDLLAEAGRLSPWWGKNAQVKEGGEIFVNDAGLAIVRLKKSFKFNRGVSPIKLPVKDSPKFEEDYDKNYAVFGIPRSSWNIPGEETPKTTIYLMKVETLLTKKELLDPCKQAFPDSDFNDTTNICTTANATFCWGCIGSPTVAVDQSDKVLQVAVITKTTTSESDLYHVHTKVAPFEKWLISHSGGTFEPEKE